MKNSSYLLVLSVLLYSCFPNKKTTITERAINRSLEVNGRNSGVLIKPILADIEISKERKISVFSYRSDTLGSYSGNSGKNSQFILSGESMKETARKIAMFDYLKTNNCDYIIDPIYTIRRIRESKYNYEIISVELNGYPAKIKSLTQPDSLPKSIMQLDKLSSREIPFNVTTNDSETEKFKPYFAVGAGAHYSIDDEQFGLPDFHFRATPIKALSLSYDFMNFRDGYREHLFGGTLNAYSKSYSGIHIGGGLSLSGESGIGLNFNIGGQLAIQKTLGIRADVRSSTLHGPSLQFGICYFFPK